jgi:hypothetical protein
MLARANQQSQFSLNREVQVSEMIREIKSLCSDFLSR